MKIKFEFEVNGFLEAAAIEEVMQKNNIKYKVSVDGKNTKTIRKKSKKPLNRKRITKEQLAAVVLCIKKNPTWHDSQVAKQTNVSSPTVSRIRNGSHALQRKQ